jgi:hypothetical protein
MQPLDLLIMILAVWRISHMISREDGPFCVFKRLREKLPLGGLTACIYCLSVWIAAALYLLWFTAFQPVIPIFALSAGALMLGSYTGASHLE